MSRTPGSKNKISNKVIKSCITCSSSFSVYPSQISMIKFCSALCRNSSISIRYTGKGNPFFGKTFKHKQSAKKAISMALKNREVSTTTRNKISKAKKGISRLDILGVKRSKDICIKISKAKTGVKVPKLQGKNSVHWIKDRTMLAKKQKRGDSSYREWRNQVWLRDEHRCKINNKDCNGKIEAHHILGWSEHVELRYDINNGITLCHAHHPRKRAEEKRLIPTFMELVSVSK